MEELTVAQVKELLKIDEIRNTVSKVVEKVDWKNFKFPKEIFSNEGKELYKLCFTFCKVFNVNLA